MMPVGTYQRGGSSHSHFNRSRFLDFDGLGKSNAVEFLESQNWVVLENDKDSQGKTIFTNTDLVATKPTGEFFFFEVEVKRSKYWSYIYQGVDIPDRKAKYYREGVDGAVMMSDEENTAMLEISLALIHAAVSDCGTEYKGDFGAKSSANFIMPSHGCHRVMKPCRDKYNGSTTETFARIPYKYIKHYVKNNGVWTLHKDAQPIP
jgi:hypothetical protein